MAKLWIPAVDAVVAGYFPKGALAPIVQRRTRLQAESGTPAKRGRTQPGIYVDAGTPLRFVQEEEEVRYVEDLPVTKTQPLSPLVHIELPAGDIVGSGWVQRRNLKTKGPRRKRASRRAGKRIWIPGRLELYDSPGGAAIVSITREEALVSAVRFKERGDHILISYFGSHATVVGWMLASEARSRNEPQSDADIGLAKINDGRHWAEAAEKIYDHPNGESIGAFVRDTEVVGRVLKNGWTQFPLATELGVLNLWSHLHGKQ